MSSEDIRPIDIMNYPYAPDFTREWLMQEEFRQMDEITLRGKMKERWVPGWTAEEFIARMDEGGYDKVFMCALKMWSWINQKWMINYPIERVYEQVQAYPDRLVGIAGYSPYRIKGSLQEIDKAIKEYGFKGVYIHPHGFGLRLDDKKFYPCYNKCQELGVPVILQTGHALEMQPSEVGRPVYLDDIAMDFRELIIVGSHTGWPWCLELVDFAQKYENIYMDISAWLPKYLDPAVVQFMRTRGKDKVMFGTNGFPYPFSTFKNQFLELGLGEEANRKILSENAIRVFKL